MFEDPRLNSLEEQINSANQTLKIAQAQFMQARALVRYYRADYIPTVTAGFSATRTRISSNVAGALAGSTSNDFVLPFAVSYEADLWGKVRRTVEAGMAAHGRGQREYRSSSRGLLPHHLARGQRRFRKRSYLQPVDGPWRLLDGWSGRPPDIV